MRNKIKTEFKETEIGEIPEEWNVKKIGDVCHLVRDSFSPSKEDSRAYIGLEHIEQDTLRLISIGSSKNINSNKLIFKKGQILFGKLRPYFRKVYRPNFEGVCSTDIFVIDANKKIDNCFLFYFFADRRMIEEATLSSEGTRMPRASWKYLENLQRGFPDILEQKAIAKILSDLDSKIELNNEMNKTLESIGQVLFRHWFVDFEFPNDEGKPYKSSGGEMIESELGEIPQGSRIGKLNEFVTISKESCNPSTAPEDTFIYYSISAYDNGEMPVEELGKNILSNKFVVKGNSILLCKLNPRFPRCWAIWGDNKKKSVSSTEFLVLIPKKVIHYSFIYRLLKSNYIQNSLQSHITGTSSSHQRVRPKDILELNITIPTEEILTKYHKATSKTLIKIDSNKVQNKSLSHIRDSLLPRFMSGRIRMV